MRTAQLVRAVLMAVCRPQVLVWELGLEQLALPAQYIQVSVQALVQVRRMVLVLGQ